MKKSRIVFLMAALLVMSFVTFATAGTLLEEVTKRGTVRIGHGNSTPPMNYIDEKGEWVGFDVDLGTEIAKRLGVKLERVLVDNKTRIAFLANRSIDISLANISATRSREEQMDYAEPAYFWTGKIFYAKKGKFKSIKDLGGKKIGVDQGSNAFIAAPQEIAKFTDKKPEMLSFQNSAEGFLALKQGKIDAYSQDAQIMASIAATGGLANEYEAVGGAIWSPGLYGIGVPENESDWRDKISFVFQDMMKDGTYEKIYDNWFGPKGKAPLSINARPRLPKETFGDMLYTWPD
ncbi:MAG: transporter substrate-binding domain-containing protein [Nitrospirae bacterium]|nr:transporter substrate-binding domain-containing protein [Nitrospirota bacterium]